VATGELGGIEQLLASRIGLDPVSVGSQLPLRAARRRMKELGLNDLSAYEHRLRSSEGEVTALIDEVVVAESWFFRDVEPFRLLRDHVRSGWLNDPLHPPLRVLSLACAGGQEPYSIAMVLSDLKLPCNRYLIDAVDVSGRQLAIARRGVYSLNSFRGAEQTYGARYFSKHPEGFEITSAIRARVRFQQNNVLDPRFLEDSPPYDVLFCRNLLIYLGAPARACVLAAIDRLLAANGLLVIGHADRLEWSCMEAKFTAVPDRGCFAYYRTARDDTEPPRLELELAASVVSTAPPKGTQPSTAATHEVDDCDTNRFLTGRSSDQVIAFSCDNEPALLAQAAALANQRRFDQAITLCERHLQLKGPGAAAYSLMGMIYQAAGNRRRAEDCFHKVVYLDPGHGEALLALALFAERRGDSARAAALRQRARRTVMTMQKRAT
jgi:chemotaxis protein methyltransferase WspC